MSRSIRQFFADRFDARPWNRRAGTGYQLIPGLLLKNLLNLAVCRFEPPPRYYTEFPIQGRRNKEPAWTAEYRLFQDAPAILPMQNHRGPEILKWAIVVRTQDFEALSFNPLERMLVPFKSPTHVARLPNLTRTSIGIRHIAKCEFGQTRILIDSIGVCDITPQPFGRCLDRDLPNKPN